MKLLRVSTSLYTFNSTYEFVSRTGIVIVTSDTSEAGGSLVVCTRVTKIHMTHRAALISCFASRQLDTRLCCQTCTDTALT